MKKVLQKKNWNQVAVHMHVEPPPVPFIKSNNDRKPDKYCVKITLLRVFMSLNWLCWQRQSLGVLVVHTEISNYSLGFRNSFFWREDLVYLYASTWWSVMSNWHVVCWSGEYYHRAFKPNYFDFRLLLFTVNALSKAKPRDSPQNEESTWIKIKTLRWLSDWS